MTLRILITGSRNWTDRGMIRRALCRAGRDAGAHPQETTVVHGGAPGADTIAGEVAAEFGCRVEVHPADWDRYSKAAGPIRNAGMVTAGADLCLAFPIGESRGTRDCIRQARLAGIPVTEHGQTT